MKNRALAKHFVGKNFMTPDVLEYGQQGNFIYELSTGEGLDKTTIYGVTVVQFSPNLKRNDLSTVLNSMVEARRYIKWLGSKSVKTINEL